MFSLQNILGGKGKIFDLLQASTETALEAAIAVNQLVLDASDTSVMATFDATRRHQKELMARISEDLIETFVTVLDREDIEALSSTLYKIPKYIEKFASRYVIIRDRLEGVDFAHQTQILLQCMHIVTEMIKELRYGLRLEPMHKLQYQLQALETEADDLLVDRWRDVYVDSTDPVRMILTKDLFEILEKAIDKCRDVGNVAYSVVLKNS